MTFGKNVEHFLVWMSSNLSKQKSPTAEIIGIYFIVPYMPIITAVWLFCFDKFEDNQTRKCSTFFSNVLVNRVTFKIEAQEFHQTI